MSALATLIALGFRNPGPAERQEILDAFLKNSRLFSRASSRTALFPYGPSIDSNDVGFIALGSSGTICRFVQLTPAQIVQFYNNPTVLNGVRAVPRLEPARCFTNNEVRYAQILYASNGYIVICENGNGTLIADDFHDPAESLHGKKRTKPSRVNTAQHIPRPPNAFILYRNCKMGEVKHLYPDLGNNDISKVIGKLWHAETPEVKEEFKLLARKQTAELLRENPSYKYQPRKASQIMRRPGLKRSKRD